MLNIKKIDIYITKEFIKIFAYITLCISILVFLIDYMEFSSKIQKYNIPWFEALKIVLYKLPSLLESIFQFIILLASIFTLTKLSITSELVAINANKYSLWKILRGQIVFVLLFGIFSIAFLNPFFSKLDKISNLIKNKYTEKENNYYITSKKGIWLKQSYSESGIENGEVIIKAERVYLDSLLFKDVVLLFTDSNGFFFKRINAENMIFKDTDWIIYNAVILEKNKDLVIFDNLNIESKLTRDFIKQKIKNEYESISSASFWNLGELIKNFEESGLDATKFIIKKHTLILTPFVYLIMVLIAGIFSISNSRKSAYALNIGKTIIIGFLIFTVQNILFELGSSGFLSINISTWFPFTFIFLLTVIFLMKKIELCNLRYDI